MKLNWTTIGAVFSALAGIAGSVITPLYGSQLAAQTADILQAVSGLLVLIGGFHITSFAMLEAKSKIGAGASKK